MGASTKQGLDIANKSREIIRGLIGDDVKDGWNTWLDTIGYNSIGTNELKQIFGEKIFDTPKPTTLIQWIVNLMDDEDGIVLDSFAGSGTTAHAVLNLNKLDGGNRKFILVEMENYAESITARRVRRVIKGISLMSKNELYSKELTIKDIKRGSEIVKELDNVRDEHKKDYDKFESIIENKCLKLLGVKKGECEGTGGSFAYYELGPELLKDGFINEDVPEQTIREIPLLHRNKPRFAAKQQWASSTSRELRRRRLLFPLQQGTKQRRLMRLFLRQFRRRPTAM
jgi:Adenine specific DNA methylase Mod